MTPDPNPAREADGRADREALADELIDAAYEVATGGTAFGIADHLIANRDAVLRALGKDTSLNCDECMADYGHGFEDGKASIEARTEAAEKRLRDLTVRLGFGDNITEPMASNDEIVAFIEERFSAANEWDESQRWRDECYAAGHPDDEDCYEHDPARRLDAAEAKVARVEHAIEMAEQSNQVARFVSVDRLRAALADEEGNR